MDCLACGPTDSPASREHVFSSWLIKAFDPKVEMELYRLHPDGKSTKEREKIKLDSFKLKRVCEGCNTGWMSLLEEAVKPIILNIVQNENRPLEDLSGAEWLSLARWAAKTAIIESHAVGAEFPVSGDYLRWMRANPDGAPGRFAVVACRTKVLAFGHMQHGIIRDLLAGHKVAGNIIVIALPRLAFVCAFPMLELSYECRCVKSLFTPLWPDAKAWYDMAQTPMPPVDGEVQLLSGLSERIELYHRL